MGGLNNSKWIIKLDQKGDIYLFQVFIFFGGYFLWVQNVKLRFILVYFPWERSRDAIWHLICAFAWSSYHACMCTKSLLCYAHTLKVVFEMTATNITQISLPHCRLINKIETFLFYTDQRKLNMLLTITSSCVFTAKQLLRTSTCASQHCPSITA